MAIRSSDVVESSVRGVQEIDSDHGRQLFLIVEGRAMVGEAMAEVPELDLIELAPGESLQIRALTSPTRYWKTSSPPRPLLSLARPGTTPMSPA